MARGVGPPELDAVTGVEAFHDAGQGAGRIDAPAVERVDHVARGQARLVCGRSRLDGYHRSSCADGAAGEAGCRLHLDAQEGAVADVDRGGAVGGFDLPRYRQRAYRWGWSSSGRRRTGAQERSRPLCLFRSLFPRCRPGDRPSPPAPMLRWFPPVRSAAPGCPRARRSLLSTGPGTSQSHSRHWGCRRRHRRSLW